MNFLKFYICLQDIGSECPVYSFICNIVIMYTIFRRNIDCQCLTSLYLFLLQLGKQLFSFSPVTLESLNYQLVVLCKKTSYRLMAS